MVRKQIEFFAIGEDLSSVLVAVASDFSFRLATLSPGGAQCELWTPAEVPDLSVARHGSQTQERVFLLVRPDVSVATRTVELRRGGKLLALDQRSHPESVFLRPGGTFEGIVIAGQVGTIADSQWGLGLYGAFSKVLRSNFKKVKSYLVGREAIRVLDGGGRLTTDINGQPGFDLCR